MISDTVYSEMSKRITDNEKEVFNLRERTQKMESTQIFIVATLEKLDASLMNIFENQDRAVSKSLDMHNESLIRIAEIEKTTNQIKMISNHWKIFAWVILISIFIGLCLQDGVHDLIKEAVASKISALKTISASQR